MSGNDRVFVFIIGAGLVMGLATTVADYERHKIDSADAYTAGYAAARDSCAHVRPALVVRMAEPSHWKRVGDTDTLQYTVPR
jgi:hypothetical protein